MNYTLNTQEHKSAGMLAALRTLWPLLRIEKKILGVALVAVVVNSLVSLAAPIIMGRAIDQYIAVGDYHGVLVSSAIILGLYLFGLVTSYVQTRLMGGVGQRVLFRLRDRVFTKLQELPVAFFNQNKAGDLISRINNDTEKLNQFFSQALVQFIGSLFIMFGAAVFLLSINLPLGAAALAPALVLLLFTQGISSWVRHKNTQSLTQTGGLSAEIQESLQNFKVVVAFSRRDYLRQQFGRANEANYHAAVGAGLANNIFAPVYGMATSLSQMIIIALGIAFIMQGSFTVGLLISFLAYATNFYNPLRQLAALWANLQVALAGWERISAILSMESNLPVLKTSGTASPDAPLLEFKDVGFAYGDGKQVLHNVSLSLCVGKTYALVGPTGGGKTTTASLMARLFDPTSGEVLLSGRDIRTYTPEERAQKIGFILQEPFLFTGTVRDNIVYGNERFAALTSPELQKELAHLKLEGLLVRFDEGLETPVSSAGGSLSLGQRQMIAFIRAVLREPEILILDEATANIDTVTEQMLEEILRGLPPHTTKVIIAHRLNTIENADEIFFVSGGSITPAGSMEHAVEMLLEGKRES